jgi:acyl-CoA hydrolase
MKNKFKEEYKRKLLSLEDAAQLIRSGDVIVGPLAMGEPVGLLNAIGKRAVAGEFDNVEYIAQGPIYSYDWLKPEADGHMRSNSMFILEPLSRKALAEGRSDFTPCHGGEVPVTICDWMINKYEHPKVKVVADVSPMDDHGYFSFGTSPSFITEPARQDNTIVILEINKHQPRVYGDNFIHISEVDHLVENDHELISVPSPPTTPEDEAIAGAIAEMVEDGSTIQLGIGGMPNVLGKLLESKKNLGAHTEMIGDAFMHLWEAGVLTGKLKTIHPRKIVATFILASKACYDWANENPAIEMYSQHYTNDPYVIAKNYKLVAINQALEVDLSGQVCSESIGTRQYSGMGGQFHFTQAAQRSLGGKAFICLYSTANTKEGTVSKVVPILKPGAAVTTLRTDVQYIATEYGIAQLKGKSIRQRALELISIAHPEFRNSLRTEASKLGLI